ncbi:MAG: hypothetical protein ACYCO0_02930 [Candidatus Micrarchaeaceae archaeon]
MDNIKVYAESVISGIAVTLLTGLVNTTPAGLVGAKLYGFPDTWLRYLVIAPQYNPWKVAAEGFVVDVILWSVVMGLLLCGYRNLNKKTAKATASRKRPRR